MDYEGRIEATYPGKFVCAACFEDEYLKSVIEDGAERKLCSYCGKRSKHDIAAPVDAIILHMLEAISQRYGDAWESGCSWDNETDSYMNETWDTDDLLRDYVELSGGSGDLFDDILQAFPSQEWSSRDPWGATDAEVLLWAWERFVNVVKYKRRFFFTRRDKGERHRDDLDPGSMLHEFGRRCSLNDLITGIPKGTTILRCRPRQKKAEMFSKPRELGPPPARLAKQSRMSPAGIPMFYGSDDKRTTLAEMPDLQKHYAIATFETLRPLRVLDLTNVKYPSIFDTSEYADYDFLLFMAQFLRDFSAPITRDDRIHIDYVPTQVITEYLRDAKLGSDSAVDGIKYRSARNKAGVCYVLFVDRYGVEPADGDLGDKEDEDEQWNEPKDGYTLRLKGIEHFTRPAAPEGPKSPK